MVPIQGPAFSLIGRLYVLKLPRQSEAPPLPSLRKRSIVSETLYIALSVTFKYSDMSVSFGLSAEYDEASSEDETTSPIAAPS